MFERLTSFARVVTFDKRGQGFSDRPPDPPTLEQTMDDALAVMDAAGVERAALFGISEGGPATALLAGSHPARGTALAPFGAWARLVEAGDYPGGGPGGAGRAVSP